jgi:hypothetical protein
MYIDDSNESFDLKQCQNGRVDTLGKKMSIKGRCTAKADDVDLDTSVEKGCHWEQNNLFMSWHSCESDS